MRPRDPGAVDEVIQQQARVECPRAVHVGEAALREETVEEPGIVITDHVLLDRAARAAEPHRVARDAERLDEVLLHHHQRFGGDDVVAVVAEHVERRRRDREASREHHVVQHAAGRAALDVVAAAAPAAERVDQAPIPAGVGVVPEVRSGHSRIVEDRDLVDRPVDRPGLESNDIGSARQRRREVGRERSRRIEPFERRARRKRPVHIVDLRGHHAGIRDLCGRQERRVGIGAELVRLTEERRLLRPGEHRARDRMVLELEIVGAHPLGFRLEPVLPGRHAGDETDQAVAGRRRGELARHVGTIQAHAHVRQPRAGGRDDVHQCIATAHLVRPIRQRQDLQLVVGQRRRSDDEDEGNQRHAAPDEHAAAPHSDSDGLHVASSGFTTLVVSRGRRDRRRR